MTGVRAIHRARVAAALSVVGVTGAVLMAIVSWQRLWSSLGNPNAFFGGDLVAYIEAAKRLMATGSPYHPAVLAGPIENIVANVPIGYLYPPPLAQLFVPIVGLPHLGLAWVWFATQAAVFVILMPHVWRAAGGTMSPRVAMALAFVLLSSWPLAFALFGGNVSGWIAIGIAAILASGGWLSGAIAASLAILKSTPAPLLLTALLDGGARRTAGATFAAIAVGSILLAPSAWLDWLRILPNIARNPAASSPDNLSPAAVGMNLGVPELGSALGLGVALAFGLAGLVLARRHGLGLPTVAAATYAYLFASPTLWDHHSAAVFPLIIAAWPRGTRVVRLVILNYVAWGLTNWTYVRLTESAQLVNLCLLVVVGVVLVAPTLRREIRGMAWRPRAAPVTSPEDSGLA